MTPKQRKNNGYSLLCRYTKTQNTTQLAHKICRAILKIDITGRQHRHNLSYVRLKKQIVRFLIKLKREIGWKYCHLSKPKLVSATTTTNSQQSLFNFCSIHTLQCPRMGGVRPRVGFDSNVSCYLEQYNQIEQRIIEDEAAIQKLDVSLTVFSTLESYGILAVVALLR